MSWNRSYASRADFESDTAQYQTPVKEDEQHVQDQIDAARKAAESILASESIGPNENDVFVNLSGHANPDHKPVNGYANDTITVSVTQKSAATMPSGTPASPSEDTELKRI